MPADAAARDGSEPDVSPIPEAGGDGAKTDAAKGDVPFPALAADSPDPCVLRDGATYHAYSTNSGAHNIPHTTSTDLLHWTARDDAMPHVGSWAEPGVFIWAPGVLAVSNNAFVLFYAAKKLGSSPAGMRGEQCIGRATSSSPGGPFVDGFGAPLICSAQGLWAIDPSPHHFANGKNYLLWRQDAAGPPAVNHAYIRELTAAGTQFPAGSADVDLVARSEPWENPVIENPSMIEIGGKVLLFYSANDWTTAHYGVGYATCSSVTGPCTKVTKNGPWFGATGAIARPGGEDFFTDPAGGVWMSFHAWVEPNVGYGNGGQRALGLSRFGLTAAGAPQREEATLP